MALGVVAYVMAQLPWQIDCFAAAGAALSYTYDLTRKPGTLR